MGDVEGGEVNLLSGGAHHDVMGGIRGELW